MRLYVEKIRLIRLVCLLALIFLVPISGMAAEDKGKGKTSKVTATKTKSADSKKPSDRFVSIDFNDVDINVFIKFISELTGRNFIVDDKVKGKVTIISPAKISEKEAYKVFESVLEVHGFATVESGKVTKIVQMPEARTKSVKTLIKEEHGEPEDKVVTQLIPLKYADADEIKRLFAPMVSKQSVILSYPQTNMLIITDVYSNIKRLMKILSAIDVTGIGREVSIVPLESADAMKMVKLLDTIFNKTGRSPKGAKTSVSKNLSFVADERTNTIVILASEADTFRAKKLIRMLDKQIPRGTEKIHVYYLEYASAEELAEVLQMLPTKKDTKTVAGKKSAPVISEKAKIVADKATNSLVIMAEKDDYLTLKDVIKKLDIPRSMVYIECLIMEVNVEKGLTMGVEWTATGETSWLDRDGAVGGGFSGANNYGNLGSMITPNPSGLNTYPPGMALGVFGEAIEMGGITFPSLAAVIQVMQQDEDINILSTPQLVTTDNHEATISIGKNLPYLTKTGTTSSSETYENYEYKDVGITLKVTPQVSEGRMVKLNIYQEIQRLDMAAIAALGTLDRPATLKRTIETTVVIDDGNTLVIGGLIDDQLTKSDTRVPCLGDIPYFGWLFKSISDSNEKSNLYFFLTPHVIKSHNEIKEINDRKRKEIDKMMKEGRIKMYNEESANDESKKAETIE